MIILDTNVISETQKMHPNSNVMAWLDAQDPTNLYLTSITVGELVFGVSCLDEGARKARLSKAVDAIIEEDFQDRVLAYCTLAARRYGESVADARRRGITIGHADGQIAAVAMANGDVPIASRDKTPFEALRLEVIAPWAFEM